MSLCPIWHGSGTRPSFRHQYPKSGHIYPRLVARDCVVTLFVGPVAVLRCCADLYDGSSALHGRAARFDQRSSQHAVREFSKQLVEFIKFAIDVLSDRSLLGIDGPLSLPSTKPISDTVKLYSE